MKNNELLLSENRELNYKESECRYRFLDQMQVYNYIPQEGEQFRQMILTTADCKAYNPNYFVSNCGNVFSVAQNKIRMLKPSLCSGGKKVKDKDRLDANWTDYLRECYPSWEREYNKGHTPQYYFITNNYPKTHELGSGGKLPIQKLVTLYFLPEGEKAFVPGMDVHHITFFDWNMPQQVSNIWTNLQLLPHTAGHIKMHNIAQSVISCTQDGVIKVRGKMYEVRIQANEDGTVDYYANGVMMPVGLTYHYHVGQDGKIEWLRCE